MAMSSRAAEPDVELQYLRRRVAELELALAVRDGDLAEAQVKEEEARNALARLQRAACQCAYRSWCVVHPEHGRGTPP